jgi:DNA mismatch endonuclease (patch repair protein)
MVDVVDQATRSRMMAGIRGKNTRPEMLVRHFLHSHGFRYRLHAASLPGRPDIVLPKWRTAIFVHGCFWHRHRGCRLTTIPASNAERWQEKFDENITRDRRDTSALVSAAWTVIVLWECGLREVEAGKRSLLWLIDEIRNTSAARLTLEWPAAESMLSPVRGSTIAAVVCSTD